MNKWICLISVLLVSLLSAIDINIKFIDGDKVSRPLSDISQITFNPANEDSSLYLCIHFVQNDSLSFALSSIKEISFTEIDEVSAEEFLKLSSLLLINALKNYPNPFNPSTTISFNTAVQGKVKVEVFNSRGQLITCLIDSDLPAGYHSLKWDGTDDRNRSVASGVYFYRVSVNDSAKSAKMLYLK